MTDRGSSKDRQKPILKPVPMTVIDPKSRRTYTRGKFLGKGGFARCYELIDDTTKIIYAGKVVSKTLLQKKHQKDKMAQEITIHQTLSHSNVVKFECFFEDPDNVYILLELCARRSLMELHKRRKAVTEPEARYFTFQVVEACQYLHDKKIIHRDLKLGNLFLNDEMQLKIGDFGLATTLDYDGERKKTLCGTPNYIAPEMLDKKGHSFEVDIWAIGCILYTLLVGKPPFETETLKDTYNRIKNNQYTVPPRIGMDAKHLISKLLAPDPTKRPTIHEILHFPFFTKGYMPHRLPTSCLTVAPKFNTAVVSGGHGDIGNLQHFGNQHNRIGGSVVRAGRPLATVPEKSVMLTDHHLIQDAASIIVTEKKPGDEGNMPSDYYLQDLYSQLTSLINSKPTERLSQNDGDETEDPASVPVYWVSKWVDYSDKYGLGYQLCDNSVGVIFNDSTKVMLDRAGEQLQYTERNNTEHYYVMNNYPQDLDKKVTLLKYFRSYMNEHLLKTGADMAVREGDELARLPYLNVWFRTNAAIVLHLSNGTLQINFFQDHSKLIVCPLMGAATYIDSQRRFRTFKLSLLEKYGCPKDLFARLRYAKTMVERLLSRSNNSAPNTLSTVNKRSTSSGTGMGTGSASKSTAMQF